MATAPVRCLQPILLLFAGNGIHDIPDEHTPVDDIRNGGFYFSGAN